MPASIEESALIDGAGYFWIFIQIILPLSKPILAAIAVFSAVGQWNSWQDNFFLVGKPNLRTLQLVLMNYPRESEVIAQVAHKSSNAIAGMKDMKMTSFTIKTTISVITALPIIMMYPMMQKYL